MFGVSFTKGKWKEMRMARCMEGRTQGLASLYEEVSGHLGGSVA